MRNTLKVMHRWVALVASIILLVTAASGAALVFEGAIDRGLNPGLWHVTPFGKTLPIDTLASRVEARFPKSKVAAISMSSVADRAWVFSVGPLSAFVNPYTGNVTGTRTSAESQTTFARRLHVLHVELFAGRIGGTVVGIVCVIALFLVITGVILWWPDKLIRIHTGARWKRVNFDLHHAFGIFAALILLVITASGVIIHYDAVANRIKALDRVPAAPPPAQPPGPPTAPALSFDRIVETAHHALAGAEVTFISLGAPKNPVTVALRFPEDHTPAGRSRLFIDRYSGAVLGVVSTRSAGIGTRLDNLKRSLHTGDVLGKPTEIIWLLATLVMLSQIATGVLMWLNARKGR